MFLHGPSIGRAFFVCGSRLDPALTGRAGHQTVIPVGPSVRAGILVGNVGWPHARIGISVASPPFGSGPMAVRKSAPTSIPLSIYPPRPVSFTGERLSRRRLD